LDIVGYKLPVVAVKEGDLAQDLTRCRFPLERFCVLISALDILTDPPDQVRNRPEVAATDCLTRDYSEECLDLVDPRGALRGKVEGHVGMLHQSFIDVGAVVSRQVVENNMALPGPTTVQSSPQMFTPPASGMATSRWPSSRAHDRMSVGCEGVRVREDRDAGEQAKGRRAGCSAPVVVGECRDRDRLPACHMACEDSRHWLASFPAVAQCCPVTIGPTGTRITISLWLIGDAAGESLRYLSGVL
jgi:hypothetical protein